MAFPISLATTFGISVDFFSCSYLDVSVHYVRLTYISIHDTSYEVGSPIRTSTGLRSLPTLRSFSQAYTSFFASNRLGIHHMHLFTWLYYFNSISIAQISLNYKTSNSNIYMLLSFITYLASRFVLFYTWFCLFSLAIYPLFTTYLYIALVSVSLLTLLSNSLNC